MDDILYIDSDDVFCFGHDYNKDWSYIHKIEYDKQTRIEICETGGQSDGPSVKAVQRNGKIGLFTCFDDGYGIKLYKSNKCPFIYDEMWISGNWNNNDGVAFAAYRIGTDWGVLRLVEPDANDVYSIYNNANLEHTNVVPCIYGSREEAIDKLRTPQYHMEYGWEQLFSNKIRRVKR